MTTVETTSGAISGASPNVFKGIPFAAPPVGALRFRPPQPPERWDGVRPCVEPGPACPQPPFSTVLRFGEVIDPKEPMSEDCLYLNVWTPACDDARRPVLVWIHGGYWIQGSGGLEQYDGSSFARDGIVLVTVNYRLGGLGFTFFDELFDGLKATANLGLLDNIAALEWVRDNIALFGGDPANVTIFGQSAGGGNVATLMAMPSARRLFRRAVPMSSAGHFGLSTDNATLMARAFLDIVGVTPGDTDALMQLPAEKLVVDYIGMQSQMMPQLDAPWLSAFSAVVDGTTLPRPPLQGIDDDIDVLVGATSDEWRLGFWGVDWDALGVPMDAAEMLYSDISRWIAGLDRSEDEVRKVYAASVEDAFGRAATPPDVWAALATDRQFVVPGIHLAERQSLVRENVWMYRFAWPTPALDGSLGATHGLDVPFFFDNLDVHASSGTLGDKPPYDLARTMHSAVVAFASSGDPNVDGLPSWPRYDTERRATMQFQASPRVVDDPEGERRTLFEGVA